MRKPCERCGTEFAHKRASRRHCSELCRFLSKIDRTSEPPCWIWAGGRDNHGYGKLEILGQTVAAHRWAYENLGGLALTPGLVIDHLCRNRLCVKPAHMEQVTSGENVLRGESPSAVAYRTDICKRGHSLLGAPVSKSGSRSCVECRRINRAASREAS